MMNQMMFFVAQAGPAGGNSPAGGIGSMFVPILIFFGIFYFMIMRPQQRKEKERRAMIENIKTGARVIFSGGIMGTVTNVKDDCLVMKIADNVKVEVLRDAVTRVIEKGEKAVEEKKN